MDFIVRRGRGLDPAVLAWLMGTLQIGPGIGDVHFVVKEASAYYSWLRDDLKMPAAKIHHTVTAGEDALTASRNDVLCVYPGAYDETAEIAWDKANTHLVGLGGPNVGGDWSEPNVVIYSDGTSVASVITVTGQNCQFHNAVVSNYGNNAACLTAFTLNKYGCVFKNMAFQGVMTAGVDDVVAAASLYIGGNAHYPIFENCIIGQDVWDEREGANSGQLRFTGTTQPNGGVFRNCRFLSRSNTVTVAMVALPANGACGRSWVFDNCHFCNLHTSFTNLNQVFYLNDSAGQVITLKDCCAQGFDEWQDADNSRLMSNMPIADDNGGIVIAPVNA